MKCPGNAIAAACQTHEDRLYDRDAAMEAIADGLDHHAARLIHRAAYHGEWHELRCWLDERYLSHPG